MPHNAEYVLMAYGLSLAAIAAYAVGLALRHAKIKREADQLKQSQP